MKAMNTCDETRAARLFELYEQPMYRTARAILRDAQQAEDAVMDAFVRVLRGRGPDGDPESEATRQLMRRAVQCAAIDIYRKNRRERLRSANAANPERIAEAEEAALPEDLLAPLGELDRRVLTLRVVRGLSVADTARSLDLSEAAVRKRQERALRRLRKIYSKGALD